MAERSARRPRRVPVVDAPSARAASLASSAAPCHTPGWLRSGALEPPGIRPGNPPGIPPAPDGGGHPSPLGRILPGHVPFGGAGGPPPPGPRGPPRGSGAAAPGGALRVIDPYGASAFLADLRPAPPAAAISYPGRIAPQGTRCVRRAPTHHHTGREGRLVEAALPAPTGRSCCCRTAAAPRPRRSPPIEPRCARRREQCPCRSGRRPRSAAG
jgi:hypothetical protein